MCCAQTGSDAQLYSLGANMRRVRLNSPPLSLLNFEQGAVIKPNRYRDIAESIAVILAFTIPISVIVFATTSHQSHLSPFQKTLFVSVPVTCLVIVVLLWKLPRRCLFCEAKLSRMRHAENDAEARSWHGRLFICQNCKKYEGLLSRED